MASLPLAQREGDEERPATTYGDWKGVAWALLAVVLVTWAVVGSTGQGRHLSVHQPARKLHPVLPAAPQLSPATAKHADVVEACSLDFWRRNAAAVENGSQPLLMQRGCNIHGCSEDKVASLVDTFRQRQLYDMLHLVPCDVFKQIQARTVWIVGDSQAQGFYRQLRCFLKPFQEKVAEGQQPRYDKYITEDPAESKAIKERILKDYDGGVEMPICTYFVGSTRVCHMRVNRANHFLSDYLPNLGLLNVTRKDVLVFNFGLWHHQKEHNYPSLIQQLANCIVANRSQLPIMIWRDISPQHFDIDNGEYPHPDEAGVIPQPRVCVPLKGALLLRDGSLWGNNSYLKAGGWRNMASLPAMKAAGIFTLETWNESAPLYQMHTPGECTHFCAPGGYSIWIWQLWKLLKGMQPQIGGWEVA